MKVAIVGASGWIGNHLVQEALSRGHDVVAMVRDPAKMTDANVEVRQFDVHNQANFAQLFADIDVAMVSIGGRASGDHSIVAKTAEQLLSALPQAGVKRLLWVGGAGSLEVSPGVSLVSLPDFPSEYKPEALAQGEALAVFRSSDSPLNWTFVSPAAEIFPGDKQGAYRIGGDQLLADQDGHSRISVSDYAVAMLDMLETASFAQQRVGVAY